MTFVLMRVERVDDLTVCDEWVYIGTRIRVLALCPTAMAVRYMLERELEDPRLPKLFDKDDQRDLFDSRLNNMENGNSDIFELTNDWNSFSVKNRGPVWYMIDTDYGTRDKYYQIQKVEP